MVGVKYGKQNALSKDTNPPPKRLLTSTLIPNSDIIATTEI